MAKGDPKYFQEQRDYGDESRAASRVTGIKTSSNRPEYLEKVLFDARLLSTESGRAKRDSLQELELTQVEIDEDAKFDKAMEAKWGKGHTE